MNNIITLTSLTTYAQRKKAQKKGNYSAKQNQGEANHYYSIPLKSMNASVVSTEYKEITNRFPIADNSYYEDQSLKNLSNTNSVQQQKSKHLTQTNISRITSSEPANPSEEEYKTGQGRISDLTKQSKFDLFIDKTRKEFGEPISDEKRIFRMPAIPIAHRPSMVQIKDESVGRNKVSIQDTDTSDLRTFVEKNQSNFKLPRVSQKRQIQSVSRLLIQKDKCFSDSTIDNVFNQHFQQIPDIISLNKINIQRLVPQESQSVLLRNQQQQSSSILKSDFAQQLISKVLSTSTLQKRSQSQQVIPGSKFNGPRATPSMPKLPLPTEDLQIIELHQNFKEQVRKKLEADNYESFSEKSEEYDSNDDKEKGLEFDNDVETDKDEQIKQFKRSQLDQQAGLVKMTEIIKLHPKERTAQQQQHLAAYLQFRVPYFLGFKRSLIEKIVDRLTHKICKSGEIFINQGEVGDHMYIIYKGRASIYITKDGQETNLAVIEQHGVVGEAAIKTNLEMKRGANVIALKPTLLLVLKKSDYREVFQFFQLQKRVAQLLWMESLVFFKDLNIQKVKLMDLNLMLQDQKFPIGSKVYQIGQQSNTFYIVREGRLLMQTVIEVDEYYRIPLNSHEWKIQKTTKQIEYKLRELGKGDMFGHEEIFQGIDRRCRVIALTHCSLAYFNRDQFLTQFPKVGQEILRESMVILDSEKFASQIRANAQNKRIRSKAIFDATKVSNYDIGGGRGLDLVQDSQKIMRLGKWLDKSRKNQTSMLPLLHQLHKVKILNVIQHEPIIVRLGDNSESKVKKMMQSLTRFVMPDYAKELLREQNFHLKKGHQEEFLNQEIEAESEFEIDQDHNEEQ